MLDVNEFEKAIKKYCKKNTFQDTLDYFQSGEGSLEGFAPPIMIKRIWDEVNKANTPTPTPTKTNRTPRDVITLKMYSDNGKAVYEYIGLNEDGKQVQCKGKFKSRKLAVKLAKRTAERCNQFKRHLIFEHGREVDGPVTMEGTPIGDFCLSEDAYWAVHKELQKAKHQSEWGGGKRAWDFS
jgi:hypothetical protein